MRHCRDSCGTAMKWSCALSCRKISRIRRRSPRAASRMRIANYWWPIARRKRQRGMRRPFSVSKRKSPIASCAPTKIHFEAVAKSDPKMSDAIEITLPVSRRRLFARKASPDRLPVRSSTRKNRCRKIGNAAAENLMRRFRLHRGCRRLRACR